MATSTEAKVLRIDLPEGVDTKLDGSILTVKGPLGQCRKDFSKISVQLSVEGGSVIVKPYGNRRKAMAVAGTAKSIVLNMLRGVTKGFTYRLKIVFSHFPVSIKVKGGEVHIENYFGERSARVAKMVGDCKVTVDGDDVVVTGVSKEDVGQTAANIEQCTKVKRKDQRVFLDGVYVYEKKVGF